MRVTLHGVDRKLVVGYPWWVGLLLLAVRYGWQPSEASVSQAPEALCELVLGHVTAADALALAAALEEALRDIPRHDALPSGRGALVWEGGPGSRLVLSAEANLLEWFSGPRRREVRALITLSRQGPFRVREPRR
jgi:hypothetical protein